MPRFATPEQIAQVAALSAQIAEYRTKLSDVVDTLAGFIEAVDPNAGLETRLITGEGRDDENWRGNLLAVSPGNKSVNVWMLSITESEGVPLKDIGPGYFDKKFGIAVDYAYDWYFGTDNKNSESEFNSRLDAVEFVFEQIRVNPDMECLPHCAEMQTFNFRRMIKRFKDASTHIAKGDFAIKISGL